MNYTEYSILEPFRVKKLPTKWGIFFIIRFLWDFKVKGGHWLKESIFRVLQVLFSTLIIIDLIVMIAYLLFYIVIKPLLWVLKIVFKETVKSFFGRFLRITAFFTVIFLVFTLIYSGKWLELYHIVYNFFSALF